ncbi:MAG TPA: ATP-binding protein [Candidatus Pacearchaeota archaeon]|nr:archaeal ATPase [archaeon BMS3Abin17]HDK42205.1 ATP-binding protein [Candidatus Pacearchaeota archaeon]HDZ61458.1 ATP-binding protein [Candidatus Pacearchaeota archaeon]
MINKELFKQVAIKQKRIIEKEDEFVERDLLKDILNFIEDRRILIISGIRRCGKSTILKEIMRILKEKNKSYCYVNFEDEKFLDFNAREFEDLNEVLIEVYGESKYYFFDEIQNIDKFETFVRRLQDEGKKIIITGSNSRLLSKEFGTRLTGRYKLFEIYPFSFREFLMFNKIKIKKEDLPLTETKVKIKKLFGRYTSLGGFPEYLKNKDEDYIKTIYENILYKDIIARYSIKKQKTIKELVNMLTTNISSQFTYNSLKNTLKLSNSITVKEYISYLNNSYLFFEIQKFYYSLKKQLNSPRKIYLIDSSFFNILGFNFSPNKGRILENIVFIELMREGKEIFYYSNKGECDFVIKKGAKITQAIQVCYNLDNKNKDREINGLMESISKFNLKEGLILTHDQEDEIKVNSKKIKIIPVWKWLLD